MALLAYQTVRITGQAVTYTAAAGGGDTVPPDDRGHLHYRNGSGSTITVTVVVPGSTTWGQAQPDVAVAILAGADAVIGPLDARLADPSTGLVGVTYSGVTTLTVAALRI